MAASSNPFQRGSRGWGCSSIKTMVLEGETAPSGRDVCELCVSGVSLAKSLLSGSFSVLPERTL